MNATPCTVEPWRRGTRGGTHVAVKTGGVCRAYVRPPHLEWDGPRVDVEIGQRAVAARAQVDQQPQDVPFGEVRNVAGERGISVGVQVEGRIDALLHQREPDEAERYAAPA